jgi:hypothetical protein
MHQRATVTMSMRELDRLKCLQSVIDGELPAIRAAERLDERAPGPTVGATLPTGGTSWVDISSAQPAR